MTIAGLSRPALAQTSQVQVIEISGTIDLGVAAFLERQIDDAQSDGASAFIVVMDTPGGRVDAAVSMRDVLLGTDVPTFTLVNTTLIDLHVKVNKNWRSDENKLRKFGYQNN